MKKLLFIVTCLFALNSFAIKAPFMPKDADLIDQSIMDLADKSLLVGNTSGKASAEAIGSDGSMQKRIARATYDVAVDGGTIAAHLLGVKIPANAIMVRSWFYTVTQFVDAGAGTVALHCETANNIFSALDITGNADGVKVDGVQQAFATFDGTGAAGVLGAECELTATVATAAQTAGKLVLFVEYLVAE